MNPLFRNPNEPLAFDQIEVGHIRQATDRVVEDVRRMKAVIAASVAGDKAECLLRYDDLLAHVSSVLNPVYLMNETHPDKAVRDASQQAVERLLNFENELRLDESLYLALKSFAETDPDLSPLERRYLEKRMESYLRNGFQLGPEDRARLKRIDDQINQKEILFQKHIADADAHLILLEADLDGLSEDFKRAHRQDDGGYKITTDYPDYDAVMKLANDESVRKRLYFLYHNRAKEKNLALLDEILRLRRQRSVLLGFPNYATYNLEDVMAKKPENVWRFLRELSQKLRPKALFDFQLLRDFAGQDAERSWNRTYITNRYKAAHFQLDEEEVRGYFSMDRVFDGILGLAQALYGIRFEEEKGRAVWHPDVRVFSVWDGERFIGRFYLDLYPRPNKYSHAACFGLRNGKLKEAGYQTPEAVLVCNFPKPTGTKPSLLSHGDVETVFHEFGHLMHQLLTTAPLSYFSGTSVARDFVEMPSQIMENWAWEKEMLQRFAFHYQTGEVIPEALIDKLLAVKHLNSGLNAQQQLFYAALDMTFHDGFVPAGPDDTTRVLHEVQRDYTLFPTVAGTYMHTNFSHLTGYAAGYYGYMWSKVYAEDMYSIFEQNGIFNPETGRRFRDIVLARGDTQEPMELILEFLGREPKMDAFLHNLGLGHEVSS